MDWLHRAEAAAILLGALAVAWHFWRGAGSAALASLETANRVLERDLEKTKRELDTAKTEIARLAARTDFAQQVGPIREQLLVNEARAADRHEAMLRVLELIARRLGADPDGDEPE